MRSNYQSLNRLQYRDPSFSIWCLDIFCPKMRELNAKLLSAPPLKLYFSRFIYLVLRFYMTSTEQNNSSILKKNHVPATLQKYLPPNSDFSLPMFLSKIVSSMLTAMIKSVPQIFICRGTLFLFVV
jgi:hypothetical protein